jgi:UDP-glucose 4-epimerase
MSTLITGNKGFIASGLQGDGIDIKDGIDVVTYKAKQRYDVVIHTAALISVPESMVNPMEYIRTNIGGTLNMVQQHPEAHFVYLSTAGVYGEGMHHTVESEPKPSSVYVWTKFMGELIVRTYAKTWVILRLTNVLGEGERGEPNVYQVFKKSDVLTIYGDGFQTRDFIEVEKVRETIMNSFNKHGVFNIGSGISKTVLEVAKEFNKPIEFYPNRPGDIRNFGVCDAFYHSS